MSQNFFNYPIVQVTTLSDESKELPPNFYDLYPDANRLTPVPKPRKKLYPILSMSSISSAATSKIGDPDEVFSIPFGVYGTCDSNGNIMEAKQNVKLVTDTSSLDLVVDPPHLHKLMRTWENVHISENSNQENSLQLM